MIRTCSHTILVLPVISASESNSLPQTVQRWCFKKCFFKWRDKVEPSVTIPDRTSQLYNKRRCVHSFEYILSSKFIALRQTWANEATISLFGSGIRLAVFMLFTFLPGFRIRSMQRHPIQLRAPRAKKWIFEIPFIIEISMFQPELIFEIKKGIELPCENAHIL